VSDLSKVVHKVDYEIKVKHSIAVNSLNSNNVIFSEVDPYFSNTRKEGTAIYCLHSLTSLSERLNNIVRTESKHNSIAVLKGLYSGGTSGAYCHTSAPFLFFDIDVNKEKKENIHLLEPSKNAEVFDQLQEIAVLVWRSNSGNGIAGILHVPQLQNYCSKDSVLHKKVGEHITEYLKAKLNVNADFDNAQSKFRQIRYLAKQNEPRELNLKPYKFEFSVKEVKQVSENNVPQFTYSDNRAVKGSIINQFNSSTSIHSALLDNNFTQINSDRYRHIKTTSLTTGVVDKNVFFNHSQSFSNYKVFTPFWLYFTEQYGYDLNAFISDLKKQGYKDIEPKKDVFKQAINKLKQNTNNREKQIFDACYDLQNAEYLARVSFANENAKSDSEKVLFYDYLKLKKLSINYDSTLLIDNWVSEKIEDILNYSDDNKKVLVCADTGTGKTTAFVRDFERLRPLKKLLILAPLTAIVEQITAENKHVLGLTGKSGPDQHSKVKKVNIVVATYEQGVKYLNNNLFDYVVIDEAHNLITANSYKREVIKSLTYGFNNKKIIGLTGTANNTFNLLGYKLINVTKRNKTPINVCFRVDNRGPLTIIKNHLSATKSKSIFRVNSIETAESLKATLVKDKHYNSDEILILNSADKIKLGIDFKELSQNSKFNDNIKIVFTTSLIDEGLSIKQQGFSDVVFIETEYNPNPEAFKQFIARFRNEDANRKYYYYYKEVKNQNYKPFYLENVFYKTQSEIKDYSKGNKLNELNKTNSVGYDEYLYFDNTLNPYALAYDVNKMFFNRLNTLEYKHYIEYNYSINFIVDLHEKTKSDNTNEKTLITDKKKLIVSYWLNHNFEVISALRELTNNKEVKDLIEFTGYKPEPDFYDIVFNNIKAFESIIINENELIQLGAKEVNSILFKNDKLNSQQIINRKITLLKNLDNINNPITKQDVKNAKKLSDFVSEVTKLKRFDYKTLLKLWRKLRCTSININTYNLIDLVLHFKDYKEDTKTRSYCAKE
jgi:hypothetical protein